MKKMEVGAMQTINFKLNGKDVSSNSPPATPLLDVLRDEFHLTGSKECCGKGECGSCTVLINGTSVVSCLVLVGQVHNESVVTVEGIGTADNMDPIQQAYSDEGAAQCGYCTPGFIVQTKEFLEEIDHVPSVDEIMTALGGNLCRCTGYSKIIKAVQVAAEAKLKDQKVEVNS